MNMKRYAFFFAFCFAAAACFADDSFQLRFDRAPREGESFFLSAKVRDETETSLKVLGLADPPFQRKTREIFAEGRATFVRVGSSQVVHFRIQKLEWSVDGKTERCDALSGATAVVRADGKTDFLNLPQRDYLAGESVVVPDEAKNVLLRLFGGVFHGYDSYFGEAREAKPGETWTPSVLPILQALSSSGLNLRRADVKATAKFTGRDRLASIDGNRVYLQLESIGGTGYEFKLDAGIFFSEQGFPLRVDLQAAEVVELPVPEGVSGYSGAMFQNVRRNLTKLLMIPEP